MILVRINNLLILIFILLLQGVLYSQNMCSVSGKIFIEESANNSTRRNTGYTHKHTGRIKKTKLNELENVVVYLEEIGKKNNYLYSGSNPVLSQIDAEFVPTVLPILKGTTVDIRNEDKIYHNVFSLSDTKPFNIGRRPKGENVPQKFNEPGIIRVFCDIHSNMSAYIVVLENPFFALGDEKGNYLITNIPAGKYLIKVWHNSFDTVSKEITLKENEKLNINFDLK